MEAIITGPSLDNAENISGISAVAQFIATHNADCRYTHFALGKKDFEHRDVRWFIRIVAAYLRWIWVIVFRPQAIIHFNVAIDRRGLLRDLPLIGIARIFRRRLVIHVHGGEYLGSAGLPRSIAALVRITFRNCRIIVLSALEQSRLQRIVPTSSISILPNCIPLDEARAFKRPPKADEALTLLFLGRISESKGIDIVFHALKVLQERGTRFRFVMAGTGPEAASFVRKFRELLGDAFEFKGVLAGAAKNEILERSDVFVLPSEFEGMPIALLESMAFGLVPITTRVGSIPTVVTHGVNGLFVNTSDPQDLARTIAGLSSDHEYMGELSRNARACVLEMCRPDQYFRTLNSIYQYD